MAHTLPQQLFIRSGATLGGVAFKLGNALNRAGYAEWGFYCVRGGFALVTKLEKINASTKVPLPGPARWQTGAAPLVDWRDGVSLAGIIEALRSRDAGRYRMLIFYVTSRQVTPTSTEPTAAFGTVLIREATDELPTALHFRPYTASHRVRVVIYEFRRPSVAATPSLVNETLPARAHLEAAGIWGRLS